MKQKLIQITKPSEILRTTNLQQCYGTLNSHDRYCALGVLAHSQGWEGFDVNNGPLSNHEERQNKIFELLGDDINLWSNVIMLNDHLHKSFFEIADYLESRGL